jgi:hypothetical protein
VGVLEHNGPGRLARVRRRVEKVNWAKVGKVAKGVGVTAEIVLLVAGPKILARPAVVRRLFSAIKRARYLLR